MNRIPAQPAREQNPTAASALPSRRRINWTAVGLYVAGAAILLYLGWAGRNIWFPVSLAFVIAMVLDPTVDRLEDRGFPRPVGAAMVFFLFIGGAVFALLLLTPLLSEQAGNMANDLRRLFPDPDRPDMAAATEKLLDRMKAHPAIQGPLINAARNGADHVSDTLSRGSELVVAWVPNLTWIVVVPVIAFYALVDFHRIYAKTVLLVPAQHRPFAQTLIAEISAVFGKYLRGLGLICILLGLCIAGVMWAWGSPYWQLWGLLGGVLYAVPVVGSLFNIALVLLVSLVTSPGKAMMIAGSLLLLTNGVFDQVVTPRILGKQVGLHPILTILALLLGYQIAGIGGMLVAVPLAACAQTIILHLIPKLGIDLELMPMAELRKTEAETREEQEEAADKMDDEHYALHTVIENVESKTADAAT